MVKYGIKKCWKSKKVCEACSSCNKHTDDYSGRSALIIRVKVLGSKLPEDSMSKEYVEDFESKEGSADER